MFEYMFGSDNYITVLDGNDNLYLYKGNGKFEYLTNNVKIVETINKKIAIVLYDGTLYTYGTCNNVGELGTPYKIHNKFIKVDDNVTGVRLDATGITYRKGNHTFYCGMYNNMPHVTTPIDYIETGYAICNNGTYYDYAEYTKTKYFNIIDSDLYETTSNDSSNSTIIKTNVKSVNGYVL